MIFMPRKTAFRRAAAVGAVALATASLQPVAAHAAPLRGDGCPRS